MNQSPLWETVPIAATLLAAIGVGVYAARTSTLTFSHNPTPERPRNCTSCVDGMDSTNTACQGCKSASKWRPRV